MKSPKNRRISIHISSSNGDAPNKPDGDELINYLETTSQDGKGEHSQMQFLYYKQYTSFQTYLAARSLVLALPIKTVPIFGIFPIPRVENAV